MGIYAIVGSGFGLVVYYDPEIGLTPLYSQINTETNASWWRLESDSVLSTHNGRVPLSEQTSQAALQSFVEKGGFTQQVFISEGMLNAELSIEDIVILE